MFLSYTLTYLFIFAHDRGLGVKKIQMTEFFLIIYLNLF